MSKRFLIIEDDPSCEAIITRVLSSIDPEAIIDSEESAEQALDTLRRKARAKDRTYDLIIADVFLSGNGTGIEFWQKYRDERPEIPILFISSLPAIRFFETIGKDTIAPAYLPKPFHFGEAKQIIEGLLVYH